MCVPFTQFYISRMQECIHQNRNRQLLKRSHRKHTDRQTSNVTSCLLTSRCCCYYSSCRSLLLSSTLHSSSGGSTMNRNICTKHICPGSTPQTRSIFSHHSSSSSLFIISSTNSLVYWTTIPRCPKLNWMFIALDSSFFAYVSCCEVVDNKILSQDVEELKKEQTKRSLYYRLPDQHLIIRRAV